MEKNRIRVGLLGAGGIAGAHAAGLAALPDKVEVLAVAEPRPARAEWIRTHFGPDVRIVRDYREILAMDEIDAVDIVLPHDLHMPATVAAAEAGKHVLVEKVMARTTGECETMIEACERAGVSLTIAHDRRYRGEWVGLKEIIDSGALGAPFFFKLDHNQNVLFPEGHWARSRERLGGGAIMSCLTHQIDGLRWYGGEVSDVTAVTHTIPERMEGETVGVVLARLAGGGLAELSINWFTQAHRKGRDLWYEMVHVCGTRGEAYHMTGRGLYLRLHDNATDLAIERYGKESLETFVPVDYEAVSGHVGCMREWIAMLRGEPAALRTSGRACAGTVEVAEAAYRSAEEGRTVTLPLPPAARPETEEAHA